MILKPRLKDFKIIGFYLGKIIIGIALFMLFPMAVSFFAKEWNPLLDFINSFLLCLIFGLLMQIICYTKDDPKWSHGMIVVSLSWFVAASVGAVPLLLSGHFNQFLDALFEAMSALSTTGLSLVNDPENERAFNELGIDVPIGATVILGKIIEEEASFSDFVDLFSFKRGKLALIRVDLPETSPVIQKQLQQLELPPNSVLVSIIRGDEIIIPKGDTMLQPMDDVIALTLIEHKQQLLNYLIGKV